MTQRRGTLLLGHPRSGTTILRRVLGQHPDIYAPPELHLFGACARMLRADKNAIGLEVGALAGLAFAGFAEDDVLQRLRDFAFGFLDEATQKAGKDIWVEKTAFDIFELEGIERLCDGHVTYLGIIRHPVDVALSTIDFCRDMGRYPSVLHPYIAQHPDPLVAFLHSWADTTRALMALGTRRPDQVTICRYEDLLDDPAGMSSEIFSAVGVSPHKMDTDLGGSPDGFADREAYRSSSVDSTRKPRWKDLPDFRLSAVAPIVADLMDMLGYDPLPEADPLSQDDARRAYALGLATKP